MTYVAMPGLDSQLISALHELDSTGREVVPREDAIHDSRRSAAEPTCFYPRYVGDLFDRSA